MRAVWFYKHPPLAGLPLTLPDKAGISAYQGAAACASVASHIYEGHVFRAIITRHVNPDRRR